MQQQFDPARHQPKAVAVAMTRTQAAGATESAGVTEISLLSLVGLAATLLGIAHYAGSDLLAQMFAL
jgi:hypothetical protein